ncbi:MAG: DUF1987 domain-containing protein [Magnetococcales bacterium]|nr:DUF1987 domain-containing protein [Magnetococcales bacterium]
MESLVLAATQRTPAVHFNFAEGLLSLSGESYPENASSFFGQLYHALKAYLQESPPRELRFEFRLAYFNSSSAKALMHLMQLLEGAGQADWKVTVRWYFTEGDDTMEEFGRDFAQDFERIHFELEAVEG